MSDQLIDNYVHELRVSAWIRQLPKPRTAALETEVRERIDGELAAAGNRDEETVLGVLDRLGPASEFVAQQDAVPATGVRRRSTDADPSSAAAIPARGTRLGRGGDRWPAPADSRTVHPVVDRADLRHHPGARQARTGGLSARSMSTLLIVFSLLDRPGVLSSRFLDTPSSAVVP